jgi:hypothetical protein
VGVAAAIAAAVILRAGRGLTFFYDEWMWVQFRRTGSIDDFLSQHGGHLNAIPVALFKVLFALVGMDDYRPYRVMVLLAHLACCAVVFAYLRHRAPDWFAVPVTVALLFLGYAWQDLLWPFQTQFFLSIAGGVGALLLIDRRDRVGDFGASAALLVAMASSGVGVPFAGAIAFELLLRRDTRRRLWVPLVPLAIYGLWSVGYGVSQAQSENIDLVPEFVGRAAAGAAGALFGTTRDTGWFLVAALVVAVVLVVAWRRAMSPRLASTIVLALGFWAVTALSRANFVAPDVSRYLYPGAVMVALVVAELVRDVRFRSTAWAVAVTLVLFVAVGVSIDGNVRQLDESADRLRETAAIARAELAAVELAGDQARRGVRPDPVGELPWVVTGPYLDAVADLGSPAITLDELQRSPEPLKQRADVVLTRVLGGRPREARPGTPTGAATVPVARVDGGVVSNDGACIEYSGPGAITLEGAQLRLLIAAADGPADVAVRHFAAEPSFVGTIAAGTSATVTLPPVRTGPWQLRVGTPASVRICSLD